jgi:hypothetical protein
MVLDCAVMFQITQARRPDIVFTSNHSEEEFGTMTEARVETKNERSEIVSLTFGHWRHFIRLGDATASRRGT